MTIKSKKDDKISKVIKKYTKRPILMSPIKESKAKVPLGARIEPDLANILNSYLKAHNLQKPKFVSYAIALALSKEVKN